MKDKSYRSLLKLMKVREERVARHEGFDPSEFRPVKYDTIRELLERPFSRRGASRKLPPKIDAEI